MSAKRWIQVFAQERQNDDERCARSFRKGNAAQRFGDARKHAEGLLKHGATEVEMFDVVGDETRGYWDPSAGFAYVEMDG